MKKLALVGLVVALVAAFASMQAGARTTKPAARSITLVSVKELPGRIVQATVRITGWKMIPSKVGKKPNSATGGHWHLFVNGKYNNFSANAKTGKSLMVPRYDIVPIPPHLRTNLASNSIHSFPAETAQSMFDFRADDVVGKIAPRPLMLLHSANDSVTPTEQSIELFKRAGQPSELHLISDADHFMFGEGNIRIWDLLRGWRGAYFPATAAVRKVAAGMGH